jgi:asparagine synthase (glutamine-hydrolysing)
MCDAIVHRGPDEDGYFVSGPVALGMRRLSIIDLESGKQPVHNEDSTIQVVFNGEIYNYRELKASLEMLGHSFYTRSDTEVIVHAYEQYGAGCFEKLRGMFGIAIWDARLQCLFLAIDRFGIKPLYFAPNRNNLIFGSELKCLLVSGEISREMDFEALSQYFTFGYIPAPQTIFRDVKKLLPGHFLRWTALDGVKIQPYWDFPKNAASQRHDRSPSQTRQELLEVLKDAVRSHLISDVPLGAFLSGGIDSSVVVALMSQVTKEPVKTFSIGFNDKQFNELDKARLVARHFHTDHHEMIVEPETVDILPKLVSHFGEPFADSSALPTYYVSKMAREHVKVALSGDGGDELFLGYTVFQGLEVARYLHKLPSPVRSATRSLLEALPELSQPAFTDRMARWKKRILDSLLPPDEAYKNKLFIAGLPAIIPMLSNGLQQELMACEPYKLLDGYLNDYPTGPGNHPLERFVYAGLKIPLCNDMLVKVDRMSMANSLEVRVPLLDNVLAEFVATIPIQQRFPHWRLKGLLKDTMAGFLPPEILNQPKQGFSIPLAAWFRGDLSGFAQDVLLDSSAARRGFWNLPEIEKMLRTHQAGSKNLGAVIWSMLIFELWCQQTIG